MTIDTEIVDTSFFEDIFKITIRTLRQPRALCVGLNFVTKDEIKIVNRDKRNVDHATDVLSFPTLSLSAGEKIYLRKNKIDMDPSTHELYIGDILICDEVAVEQATEYGHSLERERGYLFCHALMHLFGFDHITEGERAIMRSWEEKIMNRKGLERKCYA